MQQNTSVSMNMYGLWTESIGGFRTMIREWMLEITWWCSLHHWQDQPLNQVHFCQDNVWRRSNEINF